MMSNDALIAALSANLDPIKRRSVLREVGLVAALGAAELALIVGLGRIRPDMAEIIGSPFMWWKLAGLALLALVSGVTAIRSLSPVVSPRRGLAVLAALAGMTMALAAFVEPGADLAGTIWDRLSPAHGIVCSLAIIVLSMPMMAIMAILMRRGAPAHPEGSALSAGVAAGTWGALVFAFCCPSNDPLYVAVWYLAGCGIVAIAARWLLPKGYRL